MFNVCCTIDSYPTNIVDIDFSPEKSLFSLPIVRWCAGASAAVALAVTLTIIYSLRELPFDFTAAGFNYFADLYKVPATLLAIGFTLVGLCAANHRSEQTKKQIERTAEQIALTTSQISLTNNQIELTRDQNNFSNYYKHIDEFEKYFNENNHTQGMNLKFSRGLHGQIFKESRSGIYNADKHFIASLQNFLTSILTLSKGLKSNPEWLEAVYSMSEQVTIYLKDTKLHSGGRVLYVERQATGSYLAAHGWTMRNYIYQIISIAKTVDSILKFDPNYKSAEFVIDFIEMDTILIPNQELGGTTFYPVHLRHIIYDKENNAPIIDSSMNDITTDTPR